MKEAMYWIKKDQEKVQCQLCPHMCVIKPGEEGICKNKKNVDGVLYAHRYGEASAVAMDPVEKKPLYHFYPGRQILSLGTVGCNFSCMFCQNYHLVEGIVSTDMVEPEELVKAAKRHGSIGLAYTYNEPYISFEYVLDTARLMQKEGLKNVLVTNGFYNPEPFEELIPLVDAMNIDLKSMKDEFYKKYCKARLDPVLRTIERAARSNIMVELTNLIITDVNDSDEELKELVDYVAGLGADIPMHFSRYHPAHKLSNPATPEERLYRAYDIAREKLNYVYIGNLWTDVGQDSICPHCGATLVNRRGYSTKIGTLKGDTCSKCNNKVNFVS
jgi:pyruvate formate lyase activating enzyme